MRHGILMAGAAMLALSGAAFAQTESTSPAADPAQQTPPSADTATPPDASAGTTAAPETGATAPTTATEGAATSGATTGAADAGMTTGASTAGTVSAAVQADWAKYDKENAGYLTPLQFGTWVLASRGQDMTAQVEKTRQSKAADLPAVKVLNATVSDFVKADVDHDRRVTPAELSAYLGA
jgi:hypothetical protein